MKIRMLGNSIRLRLSKTEVEQLAVQGVVKELVVFGDSSENDFSYLLKTHNDSAPKAILENCSIVVLLPLDLVADWANTDKVSLEYFVENGTDNKLKLLVEKDFKCLTDRPGEDESDLFTNPIQSHEC